MAKIDTATTLEPDEWAAVWSPKEGYSFFTPQVSDETPVEDDALALMGALMRLEQDHAFRRDCVQWVKRRRQ